MAEALLGLYLQKTGKLYTSDKFLKLLILSIPLPYVAIITGWIVTEMGRQPWPVYGLLRTANGISLVPASDVLTKCHSYQWILSDPDTF